MRRKNSIAIAFGTLAATMSAQAGVVITGAPPSAFSIIDLGNNHFDILLFDPGFDYVIRPIADGGHTVIDNIFNQAFGSSIVRVSPSLDDPPFRFLAVQDIDETVPQGGTTLNLVDVDGDIGSIRVNRIGDVYSRAGDITGDITARGGNAGTGINKVSADAGNIFGNIQALNGRIRFVEALGGDIGTPANPIIIACKYNLSEVFSVGDVYADIDTTLDGGRGILAFLGAQTFVGTIVTAEFAQGGENFGGVIRVDVKFAGDMTIGGQFVQPNKFLLAPGGLTGQIIINADNRGSMWDGSVKFGDPAMPEVELTGQGYTETAESLGGGSVGLAPFELHDESCEPPNNVPTLLGPSLGEATVKLRHYGPVMFLPGSTPLTFEQRLACTADPFVLLQAADFDVAPTPGDSNSVTVSGAMGAPGFEIGYEYRIQATADLKCDQVVGNPPVAWDGPYHMIVESTCEADINGDGVVNVLDLIDLLLCFGQPAIPGCEAEDINCDGVVDVLDLIALLLVFGELCEGGESAQGGGSDELQLGLEQLGWNSWQEWVNDLRQLDPGEQTACVLQVLGVVCGHD